MHIIACPGILPVGVVLGADAQGPCRLLQRAHSSVVEGSLPERSDSLGSIGRGKGGFWKDRGYEWYAGILKAEVAILKRKLIGSHGSSGRARWSPVACAASLAPLLAFAAGGGSSTASDEAVVLPRPSLDAPVTSGPADGCVRGWLFLGRTGRVPARQGCSSAVSGYAGGTAARRTTRGHRRHRSRRSGRSHLRTDSDQLRRAAADLLLGRARPHAAEPAGTRTWARTTAHGVLR